MPKVQNLKVALDMSNEMTATVNINYEVRFFKWEVFSRVTFIEKVSLMEVKVIDEIELVKIHTGLVKPSLLKKARKHVRSFPKSFLMANDLTLTYEQQLIVQVSLEEYHPNECKVVSNIIVLDSSESN